MKCLTSCICSWWTSNEHTHIRQLKDWAWHIIIIVTPILVYSLCCTAMGFLNTQTKQYEVICHCRFTAWKSPEPHSLISFFNSKSWVTLHLFTVSWILLLLECHMHSVPYGDAYSVDCVVCTAVIDPFFFFQTVSHNGEKNHIQPFSPSCSHLTMNINVFILQIRVLLNTP